MKTAVIYLSSIQTGKAKHANLLGNVLPVTHRAFLLQIMRQHFSHLDDTISHAFHILQPVRKIKLK